jgi:hypothetical protein
MDLLFCWKLDFALVFDYLVERYATEPLIPIYSKKMFVNDKNLEFVHYLLALNF